MPLKGTQRKATFTDEKKRLLKGSQVASVGTEKQTTKLITPDSASYN